jgi:hypothetical protein
MTTQIKPILRGSRQRHREPRGSLGLLDRHDSDFILRGLRISVVTILAKQSQTWAPCGIWGMTRGTPSKCAKQTQFRAGQNEGQVLCE